MGSGYTPVWFNMSISVGVKSMEFQVRPLKSFVTLAYLGNASEQEFPHLQSRTVSPGSQCLQDDMR